MTEEIIKYRTKHKKCKWCKHYKHNTLEEDHYITYFGECVLKEKIIYHKGIPRICKYYELKEK